MKVEKSVLLEKKRPLLKRLLSILTDSYEYVSILACDTVGKGYSISKSGIVVQEQQLFTDKGYVVKVYDGESYGEYSFNNITENNIDEIKEAVSESLMPWKDSLREELSVKKYKKMTEEKISFEKSTEYEKDPSEMGDEAIIDALSAIRQNTLDKESKLIDAAVTFSYQKYHKLFLSDNKELEQNVMWSTAALSARSAKGQEVKAAFSTASGIKGAEVIDEIKEKIDEVIEKVNLLLISEPMIQGEYDCICAPDVTGMIVHEAFGHGVEMDMFVKDRALAKQYIGEYVASPLVTMHDGASAYTQTATYFFDDEGTLAHDTVIIEKGILKQGICDAQAGMALGFEPTGNGRRQSTERKAYTRMTNTYFEEGTDKVEDMIASIEYGFLLENASSGMEDPKNWGIQCLVDCAREIKDGKFTGRVFSPIVLTGYVPDLLKSITMMSDAKELSGSGMCGKGYKEWVKVSDGGPYIKARIRLG